MLKLGEKIKYLRKQKNISQEVLAEYLGISFQAVSKWETESTMPDVALIPAIASFFGVSTDELFDYDVYLLEKNVEAIVDEHRKYWYTDKVKSEQILRDGLKRYPGNEILLNCLVGVIPIPERGMEVIDLCKALIERTHCDEVKYDAYRILAEAYKSIGEYSLVKDAIEHIPEIYFTKLDVAVELLEDKDIFIPAEKEKWLSFDKTIRMYERLAEYYELNGEKNKAKNQLEIAIQLIIAVKDDFQTSLHSCRLFDAYVDRIAIIRKKIGLLKQ